MPDNPSLDTLNAELERAGKMLDDCAGVIKDLDLDPRANIGHIGQALAAIFEIQFQICRERPDLTPTLLKPPPESHVYREMDVYRDRADLRAPIEAANEKSRRLRELVLAPEILVMPGAWDPLSAILFEYLGFQAIQGSSAAIAAVLGVRDGEVIARRDTTHATRLIAAAVSVPVNADGEAGYGGPDETAHTVHLMIRSGAAGMNLEDSIPSGPAAAGRGLASIPDQLEKIAAVMETRQAMGSEFFLNARVDAFAIMRDDRDAALGEAVKRGNAYAEAGADCIFFLGVSDRETIATLVKEVAAPVSVFAVADTPSVAELQELGVARISYGSAFQRAALAALKRFAEGIREPDGHAAMREVMSGRELQEMLRDRASPGSGR
jgi:2-methylisocitrate lyase-like PEP mutase family enzyme